MEGKFDLTFTKSFTYNGLIFHFLGDSLTWDGEETDGEIYMQILCKSRETVKKTPLVNKTWWEIHFESIGLLAMYTICWHDTLNFRSVDSKLLLHFCTFSNEFPYNINFDTKEQLHDIKQLRHNKQQKK